MLRNLAIGLVVIVGIGAALYFSGATVMLKIGGGETTNRHNEKIERTVTVDGYGMVSVYPDRVRISIKVGSFSGNASEVLEIQNSRIERISKGLEDLGVDRSGIQISEFKLRRRKGRDQRQSVEEARSLGYEVENSIIVDTDKIYQVGNVIDKVIEWGATDLKILSFQVSDKEKYMGMARGLAVEHASLKAGNLVEASGQKLGLVKLIYDTGVRQGSGDRKSVNLEAGEGDLPIFVNPASIRSSVRVTFEIE